MTAKQLIELLKLAPEDWQVFLNDAVDDQEEWHLISVNFVDPINIPGFGGGILLSAEQVDLDGDDDSEEDGLDFPFEFGQN